MHIALSGELGAGCTEVGQILCKELKTKCISSADIVRSIVLDARAVHPTESFYEFEQHVRSGEVNLEKMMIGKIDELLEAGDIIVEGRSAFMLLNRKEVFKVLLVASQAVRIGHVAERRNITAEEAREAVRVSDSERKHMTENLFRKNWLDPHNYDLVINTDLRSHKQVANLIFEAIKQKTSSLASPLQQ